MAMQDESSGIALIDLNSYPVNEVLPLLLLDRSTGRNIMFATCAYGEANPDITPKSEITVEHLLGDDPIDLRPRVMKTREEQSDRTRRRAEVFTPSWICNKMNNHCDEEWFGQPGVFNVEDGETWTVNEAPVEFPEGKTWRDYVDSRRLEITCGEAPYIASRYDAATGEIIPIGRRIGILDRKLRVVGENARDPRQWFTWAYRAFQASYGFEFQGDNLLIARINLLCTFADYAMQTWHRQATEQQLAKVADIIGWNIWQMDGLSGTVPYAKAPSDEPTQMSLFDFMADDSPSASKEDEEEVVDVRIYDWRANEAVSYSSMRKGR